MCDAEAPKWNMEKTIFQEVMLRRWCPCLVNNRNMTGTLALKREDCAFNFKKALM